MLFLTSNQQCQSTENDCEIQQLCLVPINLDVLRKNSIDPEVTENV